MVADPILLTPVRFTAADPVLRIDSGTAQDIAVPLSTDRDYWFAGDGEGRTDRADLVRALQDALNLNTDGVRFTVTISSRNIITVAADASFQLLWDHANTTLAKEVFGFTGSTSSATSTTAPDAAQGCWVPSTSDSRIRPPRRDRRPQPVLVGSSQRTISGRRRAYDLSGESTLSDDRPLGWHIIKREKVLTEYAPADAPYGALDWWWKTGGASTRPIRYYEDKTDRTAFWLGRSKSARRPWAEDEGQKYLRYFVDLELAEDAAPEDSTALDALDYWHAAYSAEDIAGSGPYTWAPYEGSGPTLTHNVAFTQDVSTSPMLAAGLGASRVNKAFTPGTQSFRAASLNSFPAGVVHTRCLFRPNGESTGYLWDYTIGATEKFTGRFATSAILQITWRHDADGTLYNANVSVTDGDWHLLDVFIDPTGGAGGNASMAIYLNGADVSAADHSASLTVARGGTLGLGCRNDGLVPMSGDFLWWGVRGGALSLAAHQAHVEALGL